jgi:hypothetical protein
MAECASGCIVGPYRTQTEAITDEPFHASARAKAQVRQPHREVIRRDG